MKKKPKHCEGCKYFHRAGHPKSTFLYMGQYDNWCTKYSGPAKKTVSICKIQGGKDTAGFR